LNKLKAFLVLLIIALITSACGEQQVSPTAAPLPDTKENRLAAAKKYLQVVTPQEMLQDLTIRVMPTLPEKKRAMFSEVMGRKSLQEYTYRVTLEALVKHFTANELQAMTAFYGSPEGKAVRPKMGPYLAELIPIVITEVVKDLRAEEKAAAPKAPPAGSAPAAPAQPKPAAPKKPQGQAKPAAPAAPKAQPHPQAQPETKTQPAPPAGK
jgi:hypothetical protein